MKTLAVLFVILGALASAAAAQSAKQVKLTGQLVCSVCWFEAADRKVTRYGNAGDIGCAIDCSEQGLPQALAVEDEKGFTLYTLEKGNFKTTGKDFLDLVPTTVEIEGEVRTEKDKLFLKVNTLKVLKGEGLKPVPSPDDAVLALKDISGAVQDLTSFRGRVVVLNFWATWCVPCRKEMPDLAAIQNEYAARGVQVVGAAGDGVADAEKVARFIRDVKINFPVWLGSTPVDMTRFGVGTVLPATVIIDRKGKVAWRSIGIIDPAEVRKVLDRLTAPAKTDNKSPANDAKGSS